MPKWSTRTYLKCKKSPGNNRSSLKWVSVISLCHVSYNKLISIGGTKTSKSTPSPALTEVIHHNLAPVDFVVKQQSQH